MTLEEFLAFVKSLTPIDLAEESLGRNFVHAIPDEATYKSFLNEIKLDYPLSERIAIVGSGNWKFSLNPHKNFGEYNNNSDIDIAIICRASFEKTWEELRNYHRKNFYFVSRSIQTQIKRHGEDIYSGFVSPKWILGKSNLRFEYVTNTNKYSNHVIDFRKVNMMYFKSLDEALDYYVRGFRRAQKRN